MINKVLIEGYLEKCDGDVRLDRNDRPFCKFILRYLRDGRPDNHFRCITNGNKELAEKIAKTPVNTKIIIEGELSDYKTEQQPRTVILVNGYQREEK